MPLSLSRKRMLRRILGYGTNPLRTKARTLVGRDQHYLLHGVPTVLPPEHNLPFYQRRDPSYDAYAVEVVTALAARSRAVTVLDLGANVGDTAVAMLASGPNVDVVAVEGSPRFASYLRRNVASFGERVRVVERFVGPVGAATTYVEENGTGRLVQGGAGVDVSSWIAPHELLETSRRDQSDLVVWKSDLDGLDVPVLVEHWHVVDRCEVIWFELDPATTPRSQVDRLARLLGESGRTLRVYDNLGRPMLRLQGDAVEPGLLDLVDWLLRQREGHLATPYVDVWAFAPALADLASVDHAVR